MYIVQQNKVWRRFSNELFDGYAPEPMPSGEPFMSWRGGKISVALWQTILCFFLEHRTDEVQVRLYYNTVTRQWGAHAFPQKYPCGMTTKELEDHPNMQVDLALFPEPWAYMGTVHHHCSASAFQSGTDHTNETGIVGIHITVGELNKSILDLHGRVCMKFPGELGEGDVVVRPGVQQFYDKPNWSNWFELPAPVAAVLPVAMHESILSTLLKTPVGPEVGYPPRWKENLIRFCGASQGPGGYPSWGGHGGEDYRGGGGYYGSRGTGGSDGNLHALHTRNHSAPRGAKKPAKETRALKEGGKITALPTATSIGMNEEDHHWTLNSALSLMDPFYEHGVPGAPCGHHLDLEQNWQAMEFASLSEARTVIEKMGFVKTSMGTWCHPEELMPINAAVARAYQAHTC